MMTSPFRNRESVIGAILRRERDGLPLNCEAVKEASSQLCSGAFRHFGSWRNALRGRNQGCHRRTAKRVGQSENHQPSARIVPETTIFAAERCASLR